MLVVQFLPYVLQSGQSLSGTSVMSRLSRQMFPLHCFLPGHGVPRLRPDGRFPGGLIPPAPEPDNHPAEVFP